MDIHPISRFLAAADACLSNDEPHVTSTLAQDQVEAPQVQSPGSESSTANTFHTTCSDALNLADLPLEIFDMILSQVSRHDVRSLRLVSRICEAKASAHYFRHVVVPFRTQVLASSVSDRREALRNISASTLCRGDRVVDQFGHLIRRFALSLELDEDDLEFPPPKPKQDVIRSFWGLYRWPRTEYSRYEEVRDVETDADELEQMRAAFRCLTEVTSLGFCSDAGWGFLSGPDLTARQNTIRHRVFIDQDYRQNKKGRETAPSPVVTRCKALGTLERSSRAARHTSQNRTRALFNAMMQNAGFAEEQMNDALALLLESESKISVLNLQLDEGHASQLPEDVTRGEHWDMLAPLQTFRPWVLQSDKRVLDAKNVGLIPRSLTRAQREMLLEVEWAHRAVALSYTMAAMDCSREGHLRHLTSFNIAKIPSSHLTILSRHDFWEAFPSLKNVSLGVVADWRRMSSSGPHWINDEAVSPLDAVPLAHALINNYIGIQTNIESFHFEWICGGELASGCHQRSQHILPAPFFASPAAMARPAMAERGRDEALLRLPHVKNLSLKNCWVAPHVLLQVLRDYALCSLQRVEFESVSLSVMPRVAAPAPAMELFNLGSPSIVVQFYHALNLRPPLAQPSWLSWTGLIEHFSPSVKVRHARDLGQSGDTRLNYAVTRGRLLELLQSIIPDALELPDEEALYKIQSLTFKSCGYVNLDHSAFRISDMVPSSELSLLSGTTASTSVFTPFMQECREDLMGRIVHFAMVNDSAPLREVFHMKMGWEGVYDSQMEVDAFLDGCKKVGKGRFSGILAS